MRGLHKEGIVEPWMTNIVAYSADKERVPFVAIEVRISNVDLHQAVNTMCDIDRMEPIVVWACFQIPCLCSLQEVTDDDGIIGIIPMVVGSQEEGHRSMI